ncbi:MAG: transglycosylase SLT domain-containing protein [Bacteroidota bacterium]
MKTLSMYTLTLAACLSFAVFSSYTGNGDQEQTTLSSSDNQGILPQRIRSIDLNKSFDFAGERLPTENFDVRERLDRELLRNAYWHSNTVLNIKKAYRHFPLIERILAEHGLPQDLKYLAVAESDLSNAVSPAGARGFWQFMKGTARDYKLEINSDVDERYHLEKSTHAACQFLKKYKEKFGSWTLAAAAYNMGANGLNKEIKLQRAKSYYDLNLNQETARYVFRIVAIKEIMNNPSLFGFYIDEQERYSPLEEYYLVEVNEPVSNWGDFAAKYGISYRMLKIYNPWMISSKLTNRERKTYKVKIPKPADK